MGKERFGARLVRLRKAAGLTQLDLAQEIGISRRMVAYYEGQTDQPPAAFVPAIASALGITTDELFGLRWVPQRRRPTDTRLSRRVQQLEKLPARERRYILNMIDTARERERLRNKVSA